MRTLLFIDDHPIYRDGLAQALSSLMRDLSVAVVSGVATAHEWLRATPHVDLCLSDHRLQDGDGLTLITEVRRLRPLTAVGLLCASPTVALARRVQEVGGVACLTKERGTEAMVAAIEQIFGGMTVFDDTFNGLAMARILTERRLDIVRLASEGLLDKQIGERLAVTESAIRNHWQHIFQQLGVANRTEAVTKAIRLGMI